MNIKLSQIIFVLIKNEFQPLNIFLKKLPISRYENVYQHIIKVKNTWQFIELRTPPAFSLVYLSRSVENNLEQ